VSDTGHFLTPLGAVSTDASISIVPLCDSAADPLLLSLVAFKVRHYHGPVTFGESCRF
jgi:hypothetical protein